MLSHISVSPDQYLCAKVPTFNQTLNCCTSHMFHRYILKLSTILKLFICSQQSADPWPGPEDWARAHHVELAILSSAGKSWEVFLMLHPPALGMEEEGDLCKRHTRWTSFREKHLKVYSLPTVKIMGLEAGREGGCALTIPLSKWEAGPGLWSSRSDQRDMM